jgi:hypothetical protein
MFCRYDNRQLDRLAGPGRHPPPAKELLAKNYDKIFDSDFLDSLSKMNYTDANAGWYGVSKNFNFFCKEEN